MLRYDESRAAMKTQAFDCDEPEHVHVQRENKACKYWLTPWRWAATMVF